MQRASEEVPSGMLSVLGRPQTRFPQLCHDARIYCKEIHNMEDPVCSIANYLYPQARVIGGNKECLSYIRKHGKKYGLARMKPVPVSGAFHTALMLSAQDATYKALQEVDIEVPVINVHSNVDTSSYQNPHQMRRLLTEQVASPVKWEQLMHTLYERAQGQAFPDTYEVGPGGQLGAVLARVNMKARKEYQKVSCGEEDSDLTSNVQATAND
ncbi:PREDICTED: malonyl-CoA-acyl carrier protein transacylase, mitochondrial-like isoform X2 [Branchiostoma belcheri]|nr:PREDICTED: malonyl-CoA-acyl carrier protein transacylase, mitochondrial-like isoform X2 [Branchiostoma belcheri]XP_019638347.1 PREDICTED: malonyl-CoA-acyl carrier protein transacylase, mitochondrial-like isoform X2 [Branchiostoma belcheri]XP_019638348.1 PREDICTED: malonyl-CoA-acyl carrier protein transacylase, mitochondrial-like isoform X2 [Branchiostoma belcheri]